MQKPPIITEQGKMLTWEQWQKDIWNDLFLTKDAEGLRRYNTGLVIVGKKNGKSFMTSVLAAHQLLFCDDDAPPEIYSVAGDRDQARIIFAKAELLLKANPELASACRFYRDAIETHSGGVYRVLAADAGFRTAHGLNPSLVIYDEGWVFIDDSAWSALTFSPVRKQPLSFLISYGGFEDNEEALLQKLMKQAPENPKMYFKHFEGVDGGYEGWKEANPSSWVDAKYLENQKSILSPSAFRRLHLCQFTSSEQSFVSAAEWDACVIESLTPMDSQNSLRVVAGVDVGIKNDLSAVVVSTKLPKNKFRIVDHRIWKPEPGKPVNLSDVEHYILDLAQRFHLSETISDPWNFARSAERLRRAGIKVTEYAQSSGNLTCAGTSLFSSIRERKLETYPSPDLRAAALNAVVVETERGMRLKKASGAKKIDPIIALSFSLVGAETLPAGNLYGLNHVKCTRYQFPPIKGGCPITGSGVPSSECRYCPSLFRLFRQIEQDIQKEGLVRGTIVESVAEYCKRHPEPREGIKVWSVGNPPQDRSGNRKPRVRPPFKYSKIVRK